MLWHSIIFGGGKLGDVLYLDMLTECAQYLAMVVECSDSRIQPWLVGSMPYFFLLMQPLYSVFILMSTIQIGQIYEAVQRTSTAIYAKVRFYVLKRGFLVI
jgi:hypothetical protein